jgi:hypothetical protein
MLTTSSLHGGGGRTQDMSRVDAVKVGAVEADEAPFCKYAKLNHEAEVLGGRKRAGVTGTHHNARWIIIHAAGLPDDNIVCPARVSSDRMLIERGGGRDGPTATDWEA